MKTLLDALNEAKIDDEYLKNYSVIDREIFDTIVLMDPKTLVSGDDIKMGFGAKQFLLPRYINGDTAFVDIPNQIHDSLALYYTNINKYPKFNQFKDIDTFLQFIANPDSADITNNTAVNDKEDDPITKIYKKYYSDIDRAIFDRIIELDNNTTETNIGEIAKNLLLPRYKKGDKFLEDNCDDVEEACKFYYQNQNKFTTEAQQLNSYNSVEDFIKYILNGPESTLLAALKANTTIDETTHREVKDDFKLVATTFDYDIFEPLSHKANTAISGGYRTNDGMQWCTGSDDNDYWWRSYTANGGRIFCFMNKAQYRGSNARDKNFQLQIKDGEVKEFLNGKDERVFANGTKQESFIAFLLANPAILYAIKDKEPFKYIRSITSAANIVKLSDKPLQINSENDLLELQLDANYNATIRELIINIEKLPDNIFNSFTSLISVKFNNGVKEIGDGAFFNCSSLKTIQLCDTLEIIGKEAFANCSQLTGSIKIPDSVREIKTYAFLNDHCKLKINKARKTPIKFDNKDKLWVFSHVQAINA